MTADLLRTCLDGTLEAVALNLQQQRLLHNPSPQVDSLAEQICDLRRQGVPAAAITRLLTTTRALLASNGSEQGSERAVAGLLDDLARTADIERCTALPGRMTVKALARTLRPLLQTVRAGTPGVAYALAAARIHDLSQTTPRARFESPAMRHELGAGPHDLLLEFLRVLEPVA